MAQVLPPESLPVINPGATVVVAYTDTAAVSAALAAHCVRVIATTACFLKFGATPVATTSDMYLPADVPEYFFISSGSKISAIRSATSGNLYITKAL